MDTGAARRPIVDLEAYAKTLKRRMDPTASILQGIYARARNAQARMIFAEGDDVRVLRAAVPISAHGLGKALVVGREADVKEKLEAAGLAMRCGSLQVVNAANTTHLETYKAFLYERLQRKGFDRQDVHRLAARDRHVFSALMLAHGHGDGLVTGATRKSAHVLELIGTMSSTCGAGRGGRDHRAAAQGADRADRRHAGARMARRQGPRAIAERGAHVARGAGAGAAGGLRQLLDLRLSGVGTGRKDAPRARGSGRKRRGFRVRWRDDRRCGAQPAVMAQYPFCV
jgi:malate dehydrogenase (oxaloacetate-decarboxylating)(NADP+)